MNDILISVLIPTRARPEKLRRCIKSIVSTAASPERIEFLLWIDDDDKETFGALGSISEFNLPGRPTCFAEHGPRLGHARHGEMYWKLAQAAKGRWLWFMNDDGGCMKTACYEWMEALDRIDLGKVLLSPQRNYWGSSPVMWTGNPIKDHHTCHFPILPNLFWEQCGLTRFEEPLDTFLLNRLTGKGFGGHGCGLGWELKIVPGLTTFHVQERDDLFKEQGRTTFFGTEKDGKLLGYEALTPGSSDGNGIQ